ncbi:MAG: hypothetical protein MUF42_12145 [Cytophagaceae bacterium]|jgi:hypothetical protein|nr:hypothetical protein [Cytophagaceae bacterium]
MPKKKYKKQVRKYGPKAGGLSGISDAKVTRPSTTKDYLLQGGGMILSGLAGAALGSALGKHSLLAGLPAIFAGLKLGNPYLISGAIGTITVAGYNTLNSTAESLDMEGAKERVKNYFKNFSEKLYLPRNSSDSGNASASLSNQTTQGLEGGSYFINPFSTSGSDGMDTLHRIESQVEQMSGGLFSEDELPAREL